MKLSFFFVQRMIANKYLSILCPTLIAFVIFFSPRVVFAAPQTFAELAGFLVKLLGAASGAAVSLAIVIYFWGVVSSMLKTGEADLKKRRELLFWGVIALFVMVSVWGILGILINTLFGGDTGAYSVTGSTP